MKLRFYSTKRGVFTFGEDFSPCRLQASLTRSTAKMRTYVSPFGRDRSNYVISEKEKKHREGAFFLFGLPDRIRTYGLESRSLARYPAVPRVGIKLKVCFLFGKASRVCRSGQNLKISFRFFLGVVSSPRMAIYRKRYAESRALTSQVA